VKLNHIAWLIGAAALALLVLIGFQVKWMEHSRELLDEQFNNRVNMALCATVEKLAADQSCSEKLRACCSQKNQSACQQNFENIRQTTSVNTTLKEALNYYKIDLPFEVQIARWDSATCRKSYACSLKPITSDDSHQIQLRFKGKAEFILQKMGLMVSASIIILLLLCAIFALSAYYLLRQKRMSDRNRDFFNHMTHEFRTPLTNIRLAGTMLLKKQPQLQDDPYLGIIRKECVHLTDQVENVLHLSGLEKGDYKMQKSPIDAGNMLQNVVKGMDLQIRERQAQVRVHAPETPLVLQGDVQHLSNAFRNLIDNALKYSGEKPEVEASVRQEGAQWAVFQVSDKGIGLSEADCRRIFDKFHRADNALQSGEKGFGLGLAYVKKIVDLHRGKITVQSTPGSGTTFEMRLPL
jgi:two-component system, OmpR family, phosphate regulon sensor histidine kinase PhoR